MKKLLLIIIVILALCSIGFGQCYNAATSKGGLILIMAIISMLIALGTLVV